MHAGTYVTYYTYAHTPIDTFIHFLQRWREEQQQQQQQKGEVEQSIATSEEEIELIQPSWQLSPLFTDPNLSVSPSADSIASTSDTKDSNSLDALKSDHVSGTKSESSPVAASSSSDGSAASDILSGDSAVAFPPYQGVAYSDEAIGEALQDFGPWVKAFKHDSEESLVESAGRRRFLFPQYHNMLWLVLQVFCLVWCD